MPHLFYFADARDALVSMLNLIVDCGDKVAPRGMITHEMRHVTMSINESTSCLPMNMGRKLNTKLAAAETLQLLGGFADPRWMSRVSPRYLELTGGAMTGAYGPRLANQLPVVIDSLCADPDTRQAVATIWDPDRDLILRHGDRPCTVYVSFMIRRGTLVTSTYMRSQDVYLGLTYDLVMFSQLHLTVANVLNIPAGEHVHTVQSLHLYERDLDAAFEVTDPPAEPPVRLHGLNGDTWDDIQDIARQLSYRDDANLDLGSLSPTQLWLRQQSEAARAND